MQYSTYSGWIMADGSPGEETCTDRGLRNARKLVTLSEHILVSVTYSSVLPHALGVFHQYVTFFFIYKFRKI